MARSRRGRLLMGSLLVAALFVGVVFWLTAGRLHRDKLNLLLIRAIKSDDAAAVARLLREGADPNARQTTTETDPSFLTVLHTLWQGGERVSDLFQPRGLFLALDRPHTQPIVEAMLSAGADPNMRLDLFGETPIVAVVAGTCSPTLLQAFVSHGADLRAVDAHGATTLIYAAGFRSADNVRIVLRAAVDVNARMDDGVTALHATTNEIKKPSECGRAMAAAEMLLSHGADINARDAKGDTPLDDAAEGGHAPLVKFFLDHGASVSAEDRRRLQTAIPRKGRDVRKALHLPT